ncbi:hypothetical protein [Actinoplanes campanulatus]|uniref:hypothetical protein n=1 Tax=Actinoplanes campanulatus TaxID=113559 RepID=UPI0019449CFE|nr:hypothetical protein [Actinoplanes campanulatus]GID40176.1 hypothetical protein Aca09nite_66820 [Actinoplanes campanulatus]
MAVAGKRIPASEINGLLAGWQTYSPLLYSAMSTTKSSITRTVSAAQYVVRAGLVNVMVDVLAGATSSGGCGLQLPVSALASTPPLLGQAIITGSGAPTTPLAAMVVSTLDAIVIMLPSTSFQDITRGQRLRVNLTYRSV